MSNIITDKNNTSADADISNEIEDKLEDIATSEDVKNQSINNEFLEQLTLDKLDSYIREIEGGQIGLEQITLNNAEINDEFLEQLTLDSVHNYISEIEHGQINLDYLMFANEQDFIDLSSDVLGDETREIEESNLLSFTSFASSSTADILSSINLDTEDAKDSEDIDTEN